MRLCDDGADGGEDALGGERGASAGGVTLGPAETAMTVLVFGDSHRFDHGLNCRKQ